MCNSPLVRFRLKRAVPHDFFVQIPYDSKTHGYKIMGKKKLQSKFKSHGEYLAFMDTYCDYIEIPCGRCTECKKSYARDWSVRCYHESLCHDVNCFLTLTIDSLANKKFIENIEKSYKNGTNKYCKHCQKGNKYFKYPIDYSLNKVLIYDWLKKLRDTLYRRYKITVRYFGVGEYGSQNDRPHYHILLFGYNFPDCKEYHTFNAELSKKGVQMRISEELTELWPYGYSYIEDLNMSACLYVAKYCMKKIKFFDSEDLYDYYYGREPEFLYMSKGNCQSNRCKFIDNIIQDRELKSLRDFNNKYCYYCNKTRGGLGFNWLWKYLYDVKKLKYIVIDGKKFPIPKYYKNLINLTDDNFYDLLRTENIYYVNSLLETDPDRNSIERCEVRKKIAKAKNNFYSRDID